MMDVSRFQFLPETYLRTFDFIPLHSVKRTVDPDLEVSLFKGEYSMQISRPDVQRQTNKDHDLTISRKAGARNKYEVKYVAPDYHSLKDVDDLYQETRDLTGVESVETVIQEMNSVIPNTVFDGMEKVGLYQHYRANRTKSYKKRFGLANIANPFNISRDLMVAHGLYNLDAARRIKSHLRLENIFGVDDKGRQVGHEELLTTPEFMLSTDQTRGRFPPVYSKACMEYTDKRFWCDVGVPRRFMTLADGITIEGAVYLLTKNGVTIIS